MTIGRVNPDQTLEAQGISGLGQVYYNLLEPAIIEEALRRDEGELGKGGAFLCETGEFTGRSPKDKFTVKTATTLMRVRLEDNPGETRRPLAYR